jgi:menaquinone-9 beta-reductase
VTDRPHPSTTDILVVGAGPGGCAAAIEVARAGLDVMVVDKAEFPRDKCCGDGLTTDALRVLEDLGFDPSGVPDWNVVTDIVVRTPRGREITLPLPSGQGQYAAIVPRLDLDNELFRMAANAGAIMRDGVGLDSAVSLSDRVVVTLSDGSEVQARYLIAADGMWSPTRRALGVDVAGYRGDWHAFRQYFSNTGPGAQHLVVWFEPDLLPGYAWSFPLPGQRANVGYGILRGGTTRVGDMRRLWSEILQRPHIREVLGPVATPEDKPKAWPIPARIDALPKHSGRALFVGDAIGATDPMTGEGIAQALQSGRIAARSVVTAGPHQPDLAGLLHTRSIDTNLGRDHRFAERLQRFLHDPRTTDTILDIVNFSGWTRRKFARWMFEDYPRALLVTPDRWRRGAMSRPGAFQPTKPMAQNPLTGDGVAQAPVPS